MVILFCSCCLLVLSAPWFLSLSLVHFILSSSCVLVLFCNCVGLPCSPHQVGYFAFFIPFHTVKRSGGAFCCSGGILFSVIGVSPMEWSNSSAPCSLHVPTILSFPSNTLPSLSLMHAKNENWCYKNNPLEIFSTYKYLGLQLSAGNALGKATKSLADRATTALNSLSSLRAAMHKVGDMSYASYFKIFDTIVLPILLYGSEIWGYKHYDCIEKVRYRACKQFLQISQNTANTAAVGECGRYPIFVHQVLRCVKFWFQLVNMENHRYPKKCYNVIPSGRKKFFNLGLLCKKISFFIMVLVMFG